MKGFGEIDFDPEVCLAQLDDLEELLSQKEILSEQEDILPLFRERRHLSAYIGTYHGLLSRPNRVAFEFEMFGEFVADLVVGDYQRGAYVLVEFEDAREDSVFKSRTRHRSHFARQLEEGFSQLVDWMWLLQDQSQTGRFEEMFGERQPDFKPVLMIGRAAHLNTDAQEQRRLNWRSQNVSIGEKPISILTYDRLATDLRQRLEIMSDGSR
jgi:hypothetical protein